MYWPRAVMPRDGGFRVTVVNRNIPNMLGQMSTVLAQSGQNIVDMLNQSRGDLAYTLIDVESPVDDETVASLNRIDGVLSVRAL